MFGRIVLFAPSKPTYLGEVHPAVVTRVWSDICVNLEVLGSPTGPEGEPQGRFPTSVTFESGPRSWRWPPRV